ncbi:MAG: hypothetical protein Q9164_001744 [Protoblastenia rupestris]
MAPSLPLPAETRRTLNEHDHRWPFKFGIRAIATLFSFIGIVIFASTVSLSKKYYGGNDWVDGLPIGPLLISFLYNPTLLYLTLYRRNGKPIHPGFSVTADLFTWALAVPAIVFSVGVGWFWWWQPVVMRIGDRIPCNRFNYWSQYCNPMIYKLGRMEIAANVFLALVLIMHFVLFVYACIACHKWRMAKKRETVHRRNIELQYHRSPEEHMEGQPPAYTPSTKTESSSRNPDSPVSEAGNAGKYA